MNLWNPIRATGAAATFAIVAACGGAADAPTPEAPEGPKSSRPAVASAAPTRPPKSSPSLAPSVAANATITMTVAPTGSAPKGVGLDGDGCALLDETDVQELTGASINFATDPNAVEFGCFWGATSPGEPQYVEISAFRGPESVSGYSTSSDCTRASVAGIGAEAFGGTCDGGDKVYLTARDGHSVCKQQVCTGRLYVKVLVNEPKGALAPADLAPTIQHVFEQLIDDCDATFC